MITVNKDLLNRISVRVENIKYQVQGTGSLISFDDIDYSYIITAKHCIYGQQFEYQHKTKVQDLKIFLPKIYEDDFEEIQVFEIIENSNHNNYDVVILIIEHCSPSQNELKYYPQRNNGDKFYLKGFPNQCDDRGLTFDVVQRENLQDNFDSFRVNIGKLEAPKSQRKAYLKGISGSGIFKPYQATFYLVGVAIEVTDERVAYNCLNCVGLHLINETLKEKGKRQLNFEEIPEEIQAYLDKCNKVIKQVGPRYRPEFNIELPIQDYFQAISKDNSYWDDFLEAFGKLAEKVRRVHIKNDWKHQEIINIGLKIKDSFLPIFDYIKSIDYHKETYIDFNKIYEDLDEINPLLVKGEKYIREINTNLSEVKINEHFSQRPYDDLNREIRALKNEGYKFQRFLKNPNAQLINNPFLLITGKAGSGKTHLLCDVAKNRLEENQSIVLFLNNEFYNNEPKSQLLKLFNWANSWTEFLEKLDYEGSVRERRSLILIDALNEGEARLMWKNHIISMIDDIKKYPWIGLVLSVRTPYKDFVIPKTMLNNEQIIEINHRGFVDREFKAMQVIFAYFGVPLPSIVPLNPEFTNPLFLITLCEGLSKKRISTFPKGFRGISKIFKFFIKVKQEKIAKHLSIDPKSKIVIKALKQIAKKMVKDDDYGIERDDARIICKSLFPSQNWNKSLLHTLLSEGLLIENRKYDREEDDWVDIVEFGFERFGDHEKVAFILDEYFDENQQFKNYNSEHPIGRIIQSLGIYETELLALCIQLPEKYKIEIFDIADEEYHESLIDAFLDSLAWRSYSSIDVDKIINIFNNVIIARGEFRLLQEKLLEIATDEGHPFNAYFLHEKLYPLTLPKRDKIWSIFLHDIYQYRESKDSYPKRLIEWAWKYSPKINHLTNETVKLTAITLTWFLTSSNRYLRDTTTKALVSLLKKRTSVLIEVLELFKNVNDIYIPERLYAIAYGIILNLSDKKAIKEVAQKIYDLIFRNNAPPVHLLLRDYARLSIERAVYLNIELEIEIEKIRPPYNSQWIEPPTEKEVEKYDMLKQKKGEWTKAERGQGKLYMSVIGWGDFDRYIIGTNSNWTSWQNIKLKDREIYNDFIYTLPKWQKGYLERYKKLLSNKITWEERLNNKYYSNKYKQEIEEKIRLIELLTKTPLEIIPPSEKERKTLYVEKIIPFIHNLAITENSKKRNFNLKVISRFIIHKVFELGWTKELFGEFDAGLDYNYVYGRSPNKPERIGKKYQWIAYYEILARLADNFEYKNEYANDNSTTLRGAWYYQKHGRDIDPTSLYFKENRSPKHFKKVFQEPNFSFTDTTLKEWLNTDEDFPNLLNIIEKTDREGSTWVLLNGFKSWNEPKQPDEDRFNRKSRDLYVRVITYFVKKSRLNRLYNWSLKQNFFNNPISQPRDRYELHYKEYYWSPVYKYLDAMDNERNTNSWFNPSEGNNLKTRVLSTTENYLMEGKDYDCSIGDGVRINIPCQFIVESMPLFYGNRDGDWIDENGELVFFDATIYEKGIGSFINKKKLIKFLDKNQLAMIWTIGGEKLVIDHTMPRHSYEPKIYSGAYKLNNKREWEGSIRSFFRND